MSRHPEPSFAVVAAPDEIPADPVARRQLFANAVEKALLRIPADQRQTIRYYLENGAVPTGAADPELAKQLRVIASIRAREVVEMRARKKALDTARAAAPNDNRIRVRIALADQVPVAGAAAIVTRKPDDDGIPLVVLSESTARPLDLARALRLAASTYRQYGKTVAQSMRFSVPAAAPTGAPTTGSARYAKVLASMRKAQRRTAVGTLGEVKLLDMFIPLGEQ